MIGEKGEKGNGKAEQEVSGNGKAIQVYRPHKVYQRIYTPLLLILCMIYQRLNPDHSCDAVVAKLRSGDLDTIDQQPGKKPVSQRIRSESSAGYCKARKRLPLKTLEEMLDQSARYNLSLPVKLLDWLDRRVFLLDGSSLLARPYPELVRHYGQQKTAKQLVYWVMIRVVCLFCLQSGVVAQMKEGPWKTSEQALGEECLAFLSAGDVCIGDRAFGMFRILQAIRHFQGEALFRLSRGRAFKLFKAPLYPGYDLPVVWSPSRRDTLNPTMSAAPVQGRLIYVRLERKGFRSQDLYLFTTLLDRERYTRERLVELYGLRWHVEVDLRFVKQTLDLHLLEDKSVDTIRKELMAGMIAYNLVRLFMIGAAQRSQIPVLQLSFSRCLRRVRSFLFRSRSQWTSAKLLQFLTRLAKCTLPRRPPFRLEPRWVRPHTHYFPIFWLPRPQARRRFVLNRLRQAVC